MLDISSKINTIYQGGDFLVIEKPAGLLVHSVRISKKKLKSLSLFKKSRSVSGENTLVNWLLKQYPEIKNIGSEDRPGIVHRLDKDVSGLMVVARTKEMFYSLVEQFKDNQIKKEYLALVCGAPPEQVGLISLPIGRTKKGKLVAVRSRKKVKLEKKAFTEYEVIKKFLKLTLLKVRPLTGRTHQIRLHLKSVGCPIFGDERRVKVKGSLDRIFLHASYLGFYDLENQWREFRSEMPGELKDFLKNFRKG